MLLEVKNLGVRFEEDIVRNISFDVQKGDIVAIVGPNGSGKSVLLRALLSLIPSEGSLTWHGKPKISYIPQKLSIEKDLPLTVGEFMAFKEYDQEHVIKLLRSVGFKDEHHIENHILKQPLGVLSGGQLQRVLIAWALLDKPEVLLFDEPTSGIDVTGEETIYALLKRLHDEWNLTILLVSHDLNIVYKYANNVICINKEMVCFGPPHEVLDPASLAKLYGGETKFYQHQHS